MEKVQFGIKNVKYALKKLNQDGTVTYGAPIALQGATEIALPPVGEIVKKYADNVLYIRIPVNQGYNGDLSVYYIPDTFARDVLGMTHDQNGVLVEGAGSSITEFALMGEFETDTKKKKRWLLYNCTAGRSDFNGATKEETVDPQPFTIPVTAAPLDGTEVIKASYVGDDSDPIFSSWLSSVYMPSETVQKRVAITRGLTAADFEQMSIGMVVDYLVDCQNAEIAAKSGGKGATRRATQADVDQF